jgi:hypothetical protein
MCTLTTHDDSIDSQACNLHTDLLLHIRIFEGLYEELASLATLFVIFPLAAMTTKPRNLSKD